GSPTNLDLEDFGDGRYGLAVNTSDLNDAKRWCINITSMHPYHNPSSDYFDLDLFNPTELSYHNVLSTPVGDDFTATLEYRNTHTNTPISGATITFANGNPVTVISEGNGVYNVSLSTSTLSKGYHWYIFNATKSGSFLDMASTNVTFSLRAHYTAISVSGDLSTPFGENTSVSIVLIDLDTGATLDQSKVTSFSFASSYDPEGDAGPSPADLVYDLSTNSWSIGSTSVTLSLTMSDSDYFTPSNHVFDITIRPHYTSVTVTGVVTQPYGNSTPVTVVITDLDTGTNVAIGNVAWLNFSSSQGTQNETGSFDVVLDTGTWPVGSTTVSLLVSMLSSQYYAPNSYQFQVIIQSMDTRLYHDPIDLIFPSGDNFTIYLRVDIDEDGDYFGLPVQGLTEGEFSVPSYVISIDTTEQGIGRYKLTINASYFGDGNYAIT
ncbi:MAG: hypothetical protein P1Q69_21270, partial [Candidatus Thorarchaeota archaeon]|nr:hypothetical protein [Candidatus Thorarchaeota archaeon]